MTVTTRRLPELLSGLRRFVILTTHFFRRFFQNDVVNFGDQMKERTIGVLAILAIFSFHLSLATLSKYKWIPDNGISWVEKGTLITFCMLVMGIVAALEWEVLIPDKRDYINLTPLPIKPFTLFAAKFASLCLFISMFTFALNIMSSFIFVVFLHRWHSQSFAYAFWWGLAHSITLYMACFFSFFSILLIVSILMTVLGPKVFRRISTFIRAAILTAFTFMLFIFLIGVLEGFSNIPFFHRLKEGDRILAGIASFFPPFWFTDLYETLLGNSGNAVQGTLHKAVIGLCGMVILFFATITFAHRRLLKTFRSGLHQRKKPGSLLQTLSGLFDRIILKHPVQRAVYHFYGKTLRGSMFHRMRFMTYIAFAAGLILIQVFIQDAVPQTLAGPNKPMLTIPLILSFFMILGLRNIINIPASLEANWIFRLTEWKTQRHYFTAVRKGIFFFNLLPLFLLLFGVHLILWDARTAFLHCGYGLMISVLVMEVLFIHYAKIPFACSYLPGKEKIHLFWLLYLVLYLMYVNIFSAVEAQLLKKPVHFIFFAALSAGIILAVRIYQKTIRYPYTGIRYEEELEPVMVGLDYEGPQFKRERT